MVGQGPSWKAVVLDSHALWDLRHEHNYILLVRTEGMGHNDLYRSLLTLKPLAKLESGLYCELKVVEITWLLRGGVYSGSPYPEIMYLSKTPN